MSACYMMPLLHVLDTGGRIVEQALALAQLGTQGGNVAGGYQFLDRATS